MKNLRYNQGFMPVYLVALAVLVVLVGGVIYFVWPIAQKELAKTLTEKSVDDLSVTAPVLDLSISPLPALKTSALNLAAPQFSGMNIFSSFKTDTNISYDVGSLNIAVPSVPITIPEIGAGATSGAANDTPGTGQGSSSSGGAPAAPQIDCSSFSGVPDCAYVGAPSSAAYEACRSCR